MVKTARKFWFEIGVIISMLMLIWWPLTIMVGANTGAEKTVQILPEQIASAITPSILQRKWPTAVSYQDGEDTKKLNIFYTIDQGLQQKAEDLLHKYNPDYAVITAIDPQTGAILAMADSTRYASNLDNLALLNTFPAASISKIITAAAVLNEKKANPQTKHGFNGKVTSLYKNNVFNHKNTKYSRYFTLEESFARSANAIFGRLGAVDIGGEKFMSYAKRMGFNHRFVTDLNFDNGQIKLDTNDRWQVAETAAGYTRRNTLSPLHAATLAALAVNGGKLVTPHVVHSIRDEHHNDVYNNRALTAPLPVITAQSAKDLNYIMQATASEGSARRAFRTFHQGDFKNIKIGGKTGTLTGFEPHGKYDWFVGFGEHNDKTIAYAILCINKEKWYVKSSQLARQLLDYYYSRQQSESELDQAYAKTGK